MRDEFIIQHGGILLNLHDVDGHSGKLCDDYSAKGVCNVQLRVRQLEFECVSRRWLKDPDLWSVVSWLLHLIVALE